MDTGRPIRSIYKRSTIPTKSDSTAITTPSHIATKSVALPRERNRGNQDKEYVHKPSVPAPFNRYVTCLPNE